MSDAINTAVSWSGDTTIQRLRQQLSAGDQQESSST